MVGWPSGSVALTSSPVGAYTLVVVSPAGLVMAIWGVAKGQLSSMLRDALASVHN